MRLILVLMSLVGSAMAQPYDPDEHPSFIEILFRSGDVKLELYQANSDDYVTFPSSGFVRVEHSPFAMNHYWFADTCRNEGSFQQILLPGESLSYECIAVPKIANPWVLARIPACDLDAFLVPWANEPCADGMIIWARIGQDVGTIGLDVVDLATWLDTQMLASLIQRRRGQP